MKVPEKKSSHTKLEPDGYGDFLRGTKLVGLALASCSASLDRGIYIELIEKKKSARNISAEYKLEDVQKDFFDVAAKFTLVMQDKAEGRKALTIECSFAGHFHCGASAVPREFANRFTQSELRLILWPYFREFVSNITAKMAIPPILIPLSSGE
jgi:hypothetical protein